VITSILGNEQKVIARDVQKSDGPFFCPKCRQEMILRKGRVKTHHFAHKPPVSCQYGKGESEFHRICKQAIYDSLHQVDGVDSCELEKDLGNVAPDIYFENKSIKIAIEVQISNLTMDKIIERTKEYNRLGIYVLWLPIFHSDMQAERYAPKQWEKWLHATNFGRVYYWLYGTTVAAIHFDEYLLWVNESSWYDTNGDERSEGGYFMKSKRYRTINRKNLDLNIAQDFKLENRKSWKGGSIFIPNCKIIIDKTPAWWK
jgi:competence protein CoiA